VSKLVLACTAAAVLAAGIAGGAAARPSDSSSWSTYIVTLRPATGDSRSIGAEAERRFGGSLAQVYTRALSGFAIRIPDALAERLASDPRVLAIEQDSVVTADVTQTPATWGLDRIDQRALPLNNSYTATATGAGVTAYIIDTGIRLTHTQFAGRAVTGYDAVTSGGTANDCNGHGTHVAGTVGGKDYGVADGVRLVAVRVLDCNGSGTTSGVIAGIDWVTSNHGAGQPAVANMSLGGGASTALDNAVKNSIADGVAYAVAAGNGNSAGVAQKACNSSPARVPAAMTVSATNNADTKASWANYGTCVDWFAPGVSITSSWNTGDTATNTISGTSMATPHTAGVAALYLQGNPGATPQQVRDALYANSTKNVVVSAGSGSPNALLFESY
jgi:subtilisin family serine protease